MKTLLRELRGPLAWAASVSVGVNLLMLVSPIYMMQVFDRVLISGHVDTLFVLTGLAIASLAVLGMFNSLRQTILVRAGDWLERWLGDTLVAAALRNGGNPMTGLRQVGQLRYFVASQAVFALLDTPWIAVFAAVLWWMHPWLGTIALLGAFMLIGVALLSEMLTRKLMVEVSMIQGRNQAALGAALQSSDAVRAMGMGNRLMERWQMASHAALTLQRRSLERSARLTGFTKFVRLAVQVAVLGAGAALVLQAELSAGGMIAASILLGRCLAPAEQAIGAWRGFILARSAYDGLVKMDMPLDTTERTELDDATGETVVENLTYAPDPGAAPILDGVGFSVKPGECVAVVGPSGSGKTTLCRLLVGALDPVEGEVRVDKRPVQGWNIDQIGRVIGYLPQGVQLLPGTLRENIARFEIASDDKIVDAATRAGADEVIRRLPDGYETKIGDQPVPLSMGQLQRVGLARAMYGNPRLLVLDEPNANLDVDGERALAEAIRKSRDDGARDVLARTVITAPVPGTVFALRHKTTGGVVQPGEPILDIVPGGDDLMVDARVSPADIDVVAVGFDAEVTLTAFPQRNLPRLTGQVRHLSADRITDPQTGAVYYLARIEIAGDSLAKLGGDIELLPGMPADVMIFTGTLTLFEYLTEPLMASLHRSLRER